MTTADFTNFKKLKYWGPLSTMYEVQKRTNYSYQYLRVLACFMVLVNHTMGNVIFSFGTQFCESLFFLTSFLTAAE